MVGPMVDWSFSPQFSVEADGLYRELRLESTFGLHDSTVTWQFPLLAKYRVPVPFSRGLVRPFLEAGPSFRASGNLSADPSHVGVSAGGGLELHLSQLNIAPTFRYTRWAEDPNQYGIHTRPDQIEFLVGFSHSVSSDSRPFGRRLSVGAVLGTNLTDDLRPASVILTNGATGDQTVYSSRSGPRSFIVGPSAELRIAGGLAVEADAIYRPLREHTTILDTAGQQQIGSYDVSTNSWQFPVLAKYKFSLPLLGTVAKPFLEAGPSFRIPQTVTNFGVAAGAGAEMRWKMLNIAPAIRYTRWQADPNSRANEADLLVGVSF